MKQIKTLTEEQKSRLQEWTNKWIDIGLSTERADFDKFEIAARQIYIIAGLRHDVPIIRVPSPIVGAFASSLAAQVIEILIKTKDGSAVYSAVDSAVASAVRSAVDSAVYSAVDSAVRSAVGSAFRIKFWHHWMCGQLWSNWAAYTTFFTDVCGWTPNKDIMHRINVYKETVESACYWWPNKDFIMVCDRPIKINRNLQGQLHCVDGKSIEWIDGWGLYSLNGITMEEWQVMTPAEQIDPLKVINEINVERRRELIRKIGIERFIVKIGAKVLDKNGDYELLQLLRSPFEQFPEAKFLKMKNPSVPGVWHVEGVHPSVKTVEQAINWRAYGETSKSWKPISLT